MRTEFKSRLVAIAFICCAVWVAKWFGVQWWTQYIHEDFEQCSEKAQTTASSKDKQISLIARCDQQFAGRRKVGGGYTYYDFLQNRHFVIAGPNPTPNELKHFDEEYTLYLETQRRDAVAAALAEKQSRMAQPDHQDDRVTESRCIFRRSVGTKYLFATASAPRSSVSSAIFCASMTSPATR